MRSIQGDIADVIIHLDIAEDGCGDDAANSGWCAGHEIWLGKFDDPYNQVIALYHEYGHILSTQEELNAITPPSRNGEDGTTTLAMWKMAIEELAWNKGLEAAKRHGIEFPFNSMRWAVQQHNTYENYNG
jgi:hypothetical protein